MKWNNTLTLNLFWYISAHIFDGNAQTLTVGPTGPGGPLSPYRHRKEAD